MRQLKLGIVGMESNYVIGLMNYINADKRNPIFAMAFSTEERLENYLKEHTLDALLYEESMMSVIAGLPEGKIFVRSSWRSRNRIRWRKKQFTGI